MAFPVALFIYAHTQTHTRTLHPLVVFGLEFVEDFEAVVEELRRRVELNPLPSDGARWHAGRSERVYALRGGGTSQRPLPSCLSSSRERGHPCGQRRAQGSARAAART